MRYADVVLPVMRETRDMLNRGFGSAPAVNQKSDSAWSIVTQVDLDVERSVRSSLGQKFPDIEFVGEEYGGDRTKERYWLMDPVDGTAHYARGLPFATSMLALIQDGRVIFGAVYDFVHDRMYWAEKDGGAYCNTDSIRVSTRNLKGAFVSFEVNVTRDTNVAVLEKMKKNTEVLKTYCAGWEFAMVASGKIDARICLEPFGNDYDYAPGTLLVEEAGGVVANIGEKNYNVNNLNFIASNKVIFDELTQGEQALFPLH